MPVPSLVRKNLPAWNGSQGVTTGPIPGSRPISCSATRAHTSTIATAPAVCRTRIPTATAITEASR